MGRCITMRRDDQTTDQTPSALRASPPMASQLGEILLMILSVPMAILLAVLTYLDWYGDEHGLPPRKF